MDLFNTLNKDQSKAVFTEARYVRIIAGAGSGKTRVLVLRLVHLIQNIGQVPWRMCAITFTNKAAKEMKQRLDEYLGDEGEGVWISTIHSLCVRILREDITALDYPKNFTICDSVDQRAILKEAYKLYDIDQKNISYSAMLGYISANKGAEVSIDRAYELAGNYQDERVKVKIYEYYENRLKKMLALDFDDLLLFTLRLFRRHSDVLGRWQSRFDALFVDEFQDVDQVQFEIVSRLAGNNSTLYVVGDPDQTIYTWRGADVNIILDFEKRFKPTETIILNENYRSTTPILLGANALIKNNKYRIDKQLFTRRESEHKIYHMTLPNGDEEGQWIANKILDLKADGFDYQNIAILYRANYLSRAVEKKLMHKGIPNVIYSGIRFYDRAEVKDAMSYLRMSLIQDDFSFIRTINQPKRGIGEKSVDKIRERSMELDLSMYQTVLKEPNLLSGKAQASLHEYLNIIEKLTEAQQTMSVDELVAHTIDVSGLMQSYKELKEQDRIENMKELISDANSFLEQFPDSNLEGYLEMVALYGDVSQQNGNAVTLMTIHSAKGLEFDCVFVMGLSEGIFPNQRSISEGKNGMEEERRLAYVAFTRAKERLFLSNNRGYSFVNSSNLVASRFIREIDENVIEHHEMSNYGQVVESKTNQAVNDRLKGVHPKKSRFNKGDMITHTTFGEGLIINISDGIGQIAFDAPHGIKFLMLNHPAITKKAKKVKSYDA